MKDQIKSTPNRRNGAPEVVQHMLDERQQMLVLYAKAAGLEPYKGVEPNTVALKEFCQILVDYIAAAHFSVYERIAEGKERRQTVLDVANAIYPRVQAITDRVLEFNDRYAELADPDLPSTHR